MDQINVDEEKICFSSARKMFEKNDEQNKSTKTNFATFRKKELQLIKKNENEKKESNNNNNNNVVVSTATLKRHSNTKHWSDSNENNLANSSLSVKDNIEKNTEISFLKASIVVTRPEKPAGHVMSNRNSLVLKSLPAHDISKHEEHNGSFPFIDKVDGKRQAETSKLKIDGQKEESKNSTAQHNVRINQGKLESNKKPEPPTTNTTTKSNLNVANTNKTTTHNKPNSSNYADTRQMLLSDIVNFTGRNLKSVPKTKETNVFVKESHLMDDCERGGGKEKQSNDMKQQPADDKTGMVLKKRENVSNGKPSYVNNTTFSLKSTSTYNNNNNNNNNKNTPLKHSGNNELDSSDKSHKVNNASSTTTTTNESLTSITININTTKTTTIATSLPTVTITNKLPTTITTTKTNNTSTTAATNVGTAAATRQPSIDIQADTILNDFEKHLVEEESNGNDDRVGDRLSLKQWNPKKLIKDLYKIDFSSETCNNTNNGSQFLNKAGYVECLPISKTKDTFLKTWKRKFLNAQDGSISFYERSRDQKESGRLDLVGGNVEDIGSRMLGIEDGRGHYLIVRCSSERDTDEWKASIHSQTTGDVSSNWIKPLPCPSTHDLPQNKIVVIIEVGSCSVRAGILTDSPNLPTIFFPTIVARNCYNNNTTYGFDAFKPDIRSNSIISYPVKPSSKVDKYSLDWESLPGLFLHVFNKLRVEPQHCSVMFSAPTSFNNQVRSKFMELFFDFLKVKAAAMVSQTLLSLYSYKVDVGVVVDAGERIEILPVIDGYVVEGGVIRLPCGGQRVCETFNSFLTGRRYRFSTDAEFQLVRYAVEKLCYVSLEYESDYQKCLDHSEPYSKSLPLNSFDLPQEAAEPVKCDMACFRSPEGFFNMISWGIDSPSLPQMIHKAISLCPIDSRRQMWRNIYLSGGVTMLPNFKERLEAELIKLTPSNVAVEVHASPYRYHASYIGACVLSNMEAFQRSCITMDDWKISHGECLKRVSTY